MSRLELPDRDVVGVRADNPSPLTLTGTNTWIVGRGPAWVIDPGPALEAHVAAVADELRARGGLGGIALTHSHADHTEAVPRLLAVFPGAEVHAASPGGPVGAGPLDAVPLPGHAPDHVVYVHGDVVFSGDAVLGAGSVFIAPDPGALTAYLAGLRALRARRPALIAPGHGPVIDDPWATLTGYLEHRLERERRLLDALGEGRRTVEELLDAAWSEVPAGLRPAAALTLAAHLDKLADEGRLPDGVERPERPADLGGPHP